MERRRFLRICSGAAAGCAAIDLSALALPVWADEVPDLPHPKVLLVDDKGQPLKASALATDEAYVFDYPYASTPAFLIRLKAPATPATLQADGRSYSWPGGVGADRNIVAYTAICAHQLSYPEKESSVIAYDPGTSRVAGKPGMIVCCAHQSVYDPAAGARVMSGPAPNPLAGVTLEHDPQTDSLHATGVIGPEQFARFFKLYRLALMRQYGAATFQQATPATTPAIPLSRYAAYVAHC